MPIGADTDSRTYLLGKFIMKEILKAVGREKEFTPAK